MAEHAMHPNGEQRLVDIMRDFDVAMLVTHTPTGELRARPMFVAEVSDDGRVSFATQKHSGKTDEIAQDAHVVVCFQKDNRFVSLNGTARIRDDRAKLEAVWSPAFKPWFPKGKDDPELCILEVTPHDGELWDQAGTRKARNLGAMLKALVKGERTEPPSDTHEAVHLAPNGASEDRPGTNAP
jgi:general stress protein 26